MRYYEHFTGSLAAGASQSVEVRNRVINTIVIKGFEDNAANIVRVELFKSDGTWLLVNDFNPNDIKQIQGAFESTMTTGYSVIYLGNIVLEGADVLLVTIKNNAVAAKTFSIISAWNPRHAKFGNFIQYARSIVPINSFNNVVFVACSNNDVSVDVTIDDYTAQLTKDGLSCLAPLFNLNTANVIYCGDVCYFKYELKASDIDVYFIVGRSIANSRNLVNYGSAIVRMADVKSQVVDGAEMYGYGGDDVEDARKKIDIAKQTFIKSGGYKIREGEVNSSYLELR